MLKKLRTSFLLPKEIVDTATKYLEATSSISKKEPFISRITNLIEIDLKNLKEALDSLHLDDFVSKVSKADAYRDETFVGFREIVHSFRTRRNNTLLEAYDRVWNVIEKHGIDLFKLSYLEQSQKMEELFSDLDQSEYQESLRILNALEIYNELKLTQMDFDAVYDGELDEEAKKNYPTLSEARGQILPHINILIDAIAILEETEPGTHVGLVQNLNKVTSDVMARAKARM